MDESVERGATVEGDVPELPSVPGAGRGAVIVLGVDPGEGVDVPGLVVPDCAKAWPANRLAAASIVNVTVRIDPSLILMPPINVELLREFPSAAPQGQADGQLRIEDLASPGLEASLEKRGAGAGALVADGEQRSA